MVHEPGLDSLAFLTGFFGGCIAASLCIAVLASLWSSRLTSRVMLAVSYVCGLVLIGFGMKLGQALLATVHF
jgi:threonine/homoserine/homoserine lactone efflux protein